MTFQRSIPERLSVIRSLFLFALGAFDGCEKEFEEARNPSEAYMCFYFTAQSTKSWEEGERRVDRLMERFPERRHWLELVRGHIQSDRDERAAESSYRAAAEGFAEERCGGGRGPRPQQPYANPSAAAKTSGGGRPD